MTSWRRSRSRPLKRGQEREGVLQAANLRIPHFKLQSVAKVARAPVTGTRAPLCRTSWRPSSGRDRIKYAGGKWAHAMIHRPPHRSSIEAPTKHWASTEPLVASSEQLVAGLIRQLPAAAVRGWPPRTVGVGVDEHLHTHLPARDGRNEIKPAPALANGTQ